MHTTTTSTSRPGRHRGRIAVSLVTVLALAGCSSKSGETQAPKPNEVFVGRVAASQAYIALVSDGERVTGYLCDSRKLATWLDHAVLDDGRAVLRARAGDRLGTTVIDRRTATGSVTIAGRVHGFRATLASGSAGLYRLGKRGWVKLADGSIRGTDVHPMQTFKDSKQVSSFSEAA